MIRRCVHFNEIQNTCGAGIDPMKFRDTSGKGLATWPCLDSGKPCATTCDSRRMMTDDEIAEENRKLFAAVDKFEADLRAGNCPHCSAPIVSRETVGRCQYARPCGHRLGQVGGGEDSPW